jgi:hypothetical protein
MKLIIPVIGCFAVFLLSGCVDTKAREADNTARCTRYGVPPGSPNYADCMIRLGELDALDDQARSQRLQAFGAAMSASGAALRASQPTTVNCTSIRNGNITNTNCN